MTVHEHDQIESRRPSYLDQYRQEGQGRDDRRQGRRLAVCQLKFQHVVEHRLRDSRFGYPNVDAARDRHAHLARAIDSDLEGGATRHDRLPWLVRQIPRLVAVIDCVVLFTFCGVIFNVDLGHPLLTPVPLMAAALLAVLASGVAYTWLALTGDRLKTFRDELGEILWPVVGATTWSMVAGSAVLVGALGVLMYSRVVDEVRAAGDIALAGTAVPLGLVFAVISAVANLSVVAIHALDGSAHADQHRHAGRLLRRHEKAVHRHRLALVRMAGRLYDQHPQDGGREPRPAPDAGGGEGYPRGV
jgi:hypothetical protein